MEILFAFFLGFLQGLTEFLPISSSGHLALLHKLFGNILILTDKEQLFFDVILHIGTLLAILIVFRKTISSIIITIFNKNSYKNIKNNSNSWFVILIIIVAIPTGIIGLIIKKYIYHIQSNLFFIGIMFFITAIILFITFFVKNNHKNSWEKINIFDALIIGFVQGIAALPGISRSGATISTARFLGISRDKAGEFSFLISIPAIIGAGIIELSNASIKNCNILIFLSGFISAFISGLLTLKFLLFFIKKGKFYYFGFYLIIMSIISFIVHWR